MEPLKILVVEDNPEKLRHVLTCLESVPGCAADQIHSAHNSNEARRYLRENQFDLMVLDISLPERPENLPTPDGGIRLLEEVLERDMYFKPREVVGLTAFTEVLESAARRFAEDLWMVVQYDPTEDTWAQQLQRKVRHILLAKRAGPLPDYANYLCIVTALPAPELEAILDLPWSWERFEVPSDPTVYHRGVVMKNAKANPIIAASAARMGMTSAAILSMKMISQFRPRYLAVAGILAGVAGRCSLGDVVAADPCWDCGSGKYQVKGRLHQFAAAPYQVNINSFLRGKLSLLSTTHAEFDEIRRDWKGRKADTVLRMHIGPVASGASVLEDQKIAESILQQHRKLIGIEMETYAVLAAADDAPLPQPKAFSLKSVCDFADTEKNDEYREYAAYTSARTLRVFVERYL
jgi:nucleoside phosphorylase/CheY-like chemotaxis protein